MRISSFSVKFKSLQNSERYLTENEVILPTVHVQQIERAVFKYKLLGIFGSPILSITSQRGTVYRVLKQTNLPNMNNCVLGDKTQRILGIESQDNLEIKIITNQFNGRFLFYKRHQNEFIRLATRLVCISFWGAISTGIFAIVSPILGIDISFHNIGNYHFSIPWPVMLDSLKKFKKKLRIETVAATANLFKCGLL
jgi:hypothetical protein